MTEPRIALLSRLEQAASSSEPDVLRDALRWAIEELMEADVTAQLGAAPHERTPERTGYRNGYRVRPFDARMGALELANSGPGQARTSPSGSPSRDGGMSGPVWRSSGRRT